LRTGKQRAKSIEQKKIFIFFIDFLTPSASRLMPSLSNHPIRPRQHVGRNRQTDLLGGFQGECQSEFRRLLETQGGSVTFEV
jgi:hypothetical protein